MIFDIVFENYPLGVRICILAGLIDSDGCITWSWSKDQAFIPSIYVTQKKNMQILIFLKESFGGNKSKNGNWVLKNIRNVQLNHEDWLYSRAGVWSSCRLLSSRRLDAHLLNHVMEMYVLPKVHRTKEGTAVLIRLRSFLHGGTTTSLAMSQQQLCERRGVSEQIYAAQEQKTRDIVALAMKEVRQNKNRVTSVLLSGAFSLANCIDPWQVVGFFFGDGGIHVVWGSKVITTTLNWTGDRASARALEFYAWSLIRDGVHRKAWKSKTRDCSRLIVHGVRTFADHIIPFFREFVPPPCEKTTILFHILETATLLKRLQTKTTWDSSDYEQLSRVIHETWDFNTSGPARKFRSPEVYFEHVKTLRERSELCIR